MSRVIIKNRNVGILRLMLEPWARSFDIPPDAVVEILGDFDNDTRRVELESYPGNFIALWAPADAVVWMDGIEMTPIKEE